MTRRPTQAANGGAANEATALFEGPGEMRARCRALDWAATPLGPVSVWPQSLKTIARVILASRNPMFLWWGPELVQLYNDAYRPSFGRSGRHPRALGMRAADCWTDIWPAIAPQIEQVMNGGEATWHEDQYLPIERNGRLEDVWWTYSYSAVYDDGGHVAGTLVVCQETTARVLSVRERERLLAEAARAERALRDSERRYRALFDSLDEGFAVLEVCFDAENRPVDYAFIEANPAFERQTGLVGAVGRTARDLVPGLEEDWFDRYGHVALTGEATRFESGSDAMGRWFDVYAFRVGRAEARHVAVLFNDVTRTKAAARERDRLLRALEVEQARLEEVFRQAPTFLAVLRGPEHVVELANDAYYQLVGHRTLLGHPVAEALPEVRDQGFIEILDRVLATGEPFVGRDVPIKLQRTPGAPLEERFVDFVYQALTEADGTRSGVAAHGSDVTAQVFARREIERLLADAERLLGESERARAEAEAARHDAEAANGAKADFLATMSHELRTPLNAIGGYAELLEMGIRGPVTTEQRTDLARIQQSQRHLLGLVNEVLDLAKVDSGELRVEHEPVRVGDTVDAALALVRPQAAAKALVLSETCGGAADRPYLGDEPRVRQVLVNLLANAVKFTAPGGRVAVSCALTDAPPRDAALAAERPYVALRVEDTGVGIAPDQLTRIFEPFTQAEGGLTRPRGGTGLGLAISRRLARLMRGDLTVASRPGEGSIFTLWLPTLERRAQARSGSETAASTSARHDDDRAQFRSERARPMLDASQDATGLSRIGEELVVDVDAVVRAWVAALRADRAIPRTPERSDAELEDHAATFVTGVALALRTIGQAGGSTGTLLRDGTAILAVIAERHGGQRARLGWPDDAITREFALLGDAMCDAVARVASRVDIDASIAAQARAIVAQLVDQGTRVSLSGYRLLTGGSGG